MAKLRLAGVLTAIALLVGLLGSAVTVSAQGVTVITGEVTFSGVAAPMGTQVRVVDADGQVVASTITGRSGFAANGYRIDISLTSNDPLAGATVSLQALTGVNTLDGATWAPAAGAVTVEVTANSVITQDIETDTPAPTEGINVTKAEIEAIVAAYVEANRASLRGAAGARGAAGGAGGSVWPDLPDLPVIRAQRDLRVREARLAVRVRRVLVASRVPVARMALTASLGHGARRATKGRRVLRARKALPARTARTAQLVVPARLAKMPARGSRWSLSSSQSSRQSAQAQA